jgi:soluble P-type ATPase
LPVLENGEQASRREVALQGRPGIGIDIPGFGRLSIEHILTDYTGTLSRGGKLVPGVVDRLRRLKELVKVHVISADSFGTASGQLAAIPLEPYILEQGKKHDIEKLNYVSRNGLDPSRIAAFGNGNNDVLLLEEVSQGGGLAIAVDNGEGCSVQAMQKATLFIVNIVNGLDLLLEPTRCKATLRK